MRCPYCHENIRIQGRFCPKCGAQIFGRPLRREVGPSQPPPAGATAAPEPNRIGSDVIDIDLEEPAESIAAEADAVGKSCPYCRFPIKSPEAATVCSECGVPHHTDCWQENGGCTTYGCRQAPQAGAAAQAPRRRGRADEWLPRRSIAPEWHGPLPTGAREILEAELDVQATNALIFAALSPFCCGLSGILSLFWSVSILSQIKKWGLSGSPARTKAIAAIVLSIAVMLLALIGLGVIGGW